MSDLVLARGASGFLVRKLQEDLVTLGFHPGPRDGVFDEGTAASVRAFQKENRLRESGEVDRATWTGITGQTPPCLRKRVLQLSAAFDGRTFGRVEPDPAGAGLRFGIVGFGLATGHIGRLVADAVSVDPALVKKPFGEGSRELLEVLSLAPEQQAFWASTICEERTVAEPWRSRFEAFGANEEIQELEMHMVEDEWFQPAVRTARVLDLASELGVALAFDVVLQNGGVPTAADARIRMGRRRVRTEAEMRVLVATSVISATAPTERPQVRSRKLTIAAGEGVVDGRRYTLSAWGIDESPAFPRGAAAGMASA